jgi:hypothetical protein
MPKMINKILKNKELISVIFLLILIPNISNADPLVITSNGSITVSATVGSVTPPNPPSGGGGGGGGGTTPPPPLTIPTVVNFSGMAYPLSKVYILKDSQVAVTTIADPGANFSVSLTDLTTNTYKFSVYGEDAQGRKSSPFSFPIYVTSGTTVNIGNIFLSPTIDIDKSQVKKGDNLAIFGQVAPSSEVTISVHSDPEYFFKVNSNSIGAYLYNLDTSTIDLGKHQTKSKGALNGKLSSFSAPLSFTVGSENKEKEINECSKIKSDLNCDGKVNLVDFSIMAFWYKKPLPPVKIDLNNDGKISLVDFSIMAFNWTG